MKIKYFIYALFFLAALLDAVVFVRAQQSPVLTASLHSDSPAAQSLSMNAQDVDVARITLAATGGDVFLNGIYLVTDVPGGLSNFTDIRIIDTATGTNLVTYSIANSSSNLAQFSAVTIGLDRQKTYLVRASLAQSAAGTVRLGFSGFTFATQATPAVVGVPVYGNAMTLPGATPTPIPTPSLTPTPSVSSEITVVQRPDLTAQVNALKDGQLVKSPDHTAVWVIKVVGDKKFRRWLIAPQVLAAYGLGFDRIVSVEQDVIDELPMSGLVRRFGDSKIYELWDIVEGKTGMLRWIPTETDFVGLGFDFSAVYTINDREFAFYTIGPDLKKR